MFYLNLQEVKEFPNKPYRTMLALLLCFLCLISFSLHFIIIVHYIQRCLQHVRQQMSLDIYYYFRNEEILSPLREIYFASILMLFILLPFLSLLLPPI